MSRISRRVLILMSAIVVVAALPLTASANHSWGGYHWARPANPFTLKLGDNVTAAWDSYLATTSSDWSVPVIVGAPDVLDTTIVAGGSRSAKLCDAKTGLVQVCNAKYGSNGWLGIASIWASGSHITKASVKLNDTYFSTAYYNTAAWRNLVMCQEVGHTFGLGHQDEDFANANLDTCMDYSNSPESNQQPNTHDYAQLATIYNHTDSTSTVASTPATSPSAGAGDVADAAWGRLMQVTSGGHGAWYERDLGSGDVVVTHVFWAD